MTFLFIAVSCMRDDVVEMTVNIEENSIGNEFNLDGWTLGTRLN